MRVVSEQELVKGHVRGDRVKDASGKMIIPRLMDPTEESPTDPIVLAVEAIRKSLQEISSGGQETGKVMTILAQCMTRMVTEKQSGPSLTSWSFQVRRGSDGLIEEIIASPVKE